ncbi:uncharacterized protein CCOS01_09882 [Colletotrichum costaricense]|uniref:Secreted protein n=2 Tax=Colletotrichum acutatum species complex TaxID=2707335 RepID=A0AAI9YSP6_9PEZI|nr:uncharacterized protein CCOS01_09882 [Colletotrichum costaricense]XP_060378537.1 uncharacterized protein CTAM01_10877 [Colletotrichum tamarilloi]KAI3547577.1 hypothetical protein CSPX01_03580 [Colletotrichum filicis]KAK1490208.1 hypothetical protein CTAM01_10877 [Colletotrichum tamarilloi]KAK1522170.1 hypothetical protein CCOS01_09882 [Colletotrichum costaricense]
MFWTPRSCRYFFSVANLCFSLLQRTISTNQPETRLCEHHHVKVSTRQLFSCVRECDRKQPLSMLRPDA